MDGLSLEKFEEKWYSIHEEIGDLRLSGLSLQRAVSFIIIFDPLNIPVSKMI